MEKRNCPRCGETLEFSRVPPRFCSACGLSLTPNPQEATIPFEVTAADPARTVTDAGRAHPDAVGGYRLLREIGSGGMGSVFEAEDPGSGRHVALKLIQPEFAEHADAV